MPWIFKEKKCPVCNGSGRERAIKGDRDRNCSKCFGAGTIPYRVWEFERKDSISYGLCTCGHKVASDEYVCPNCGVRIH